jgi:transposase
VISGIIYVIRRGLQWKDAPRGYGPPKTLYNQSPWRVRAYPRSPRVRGGHARAVDDRRDASEGAPHGGQFAAKGAFPRCIGRTKGGLNLKLHAVCDGHGRPVLLLLTEGQMSDHKGAAMMLPGLPPARELLADRGYDSNRVRTALLERGITPCIPSTRSRKVNIPDDKNLYRQRHQSIDYRLSPLQRGFGYLR